MHACMHTYKHTNKQASKQTNIQTDRQTYIFQYIYIYCSLSIDFGRLKVGEAWLVAPPGSPVGSCGTMRTRWAFWLRAWGMHGSWMETSWVNQGGVKIKHRIWTSDLGDCMQHVKTMLSMCPYQLYSNIFLVFLLGCDRYFTGWTVDSFFFPGIFTRVWYRSS